MKKILSIALALLMLIPLAVFDTGAAAVTADTSWYNASQNEFVITTASQLMGIASAGTDFAGKTVKLGADITVNTGDASSWLYSAPETSWTPIYGFAGTFDGQGHTVSGLYSQRSSDAGLFSDVAQTAVIKNFRLVNSMFRTTSSTVGGVASSGGGTFENIYCSAVISSGQYNAGGILGSATKETVTVRNCWFDGKITLTMRYAAGIVGNGNGKDVVIQHCLNSGSVRTTQNEAANSHIAGMCGRNDSSTTIADCLNTGAISSLYYDKHGTDVMGSIFGACSKDDKNEDGTWKSKVNITNSWASITSCPYVFGANSSTDPSQLKDYNTVNAGLLVGYNAYYNTTLDFADNWAVNMDGVPMPKVFAETVPQIYNVNAPSISEAEVKATGRYGPRWTVTLTVPAGFTKDDVKLGLVAAPTKVLPDENYVISLADSTLSYRGKDYPVLSVKAASLRESDANTIVATFVISNLNENTIRSNLTVRPYAVYTVPEGEMTVYGSTASTSFYTEAKTVSDSALRAKVDKALAQVDEAIGEGFTVSKAWSTRDIFELLPAVTSSGASIVAAEDKGCGEYTIVVDGAAAQYDSYVALLQSLGFTKVVDNGSGLKNTVRTANLTLGDLMVCVTSVARQNKLVISSMFDQPLSEHLFNNYAGTAVSGKVTTLHQICLYYWGDSYVIQLKNGHFIIFDGATDYELGYLLDYLETLVPAGEKPVIEAWCNTHLHYDHFHLLNQFNTNPSWIDRVYVEGFYLNEPSNAVKDIDPGVYSQIALQRLAISKLKTTKGTTPEIYRPQMGQRYYFCDVTMDIFLSQEHIPISTYTGGFNDSSNWYVVTMDGQTFMEGGDGHQADMRYLMNTFTSSDLQVDFFSVLHHSYNTWDTFTNYVGTFKTILYPTMAKEKAGVLNQARHKLLNSKGLEYFFAGEGTDVFYIPYTPGKTGTDGGHVKLPDLPEHYGS